ncbi:MAG: hypothetical protein RBT35_02670 [Bacteroidales bacterium]|jgi:hypothetical protein|nr:hypothetical protein [Bacteroidales bacterium]
MRIMGIIQLALLLPALLFFSPDADAQELFGKAKNNYRNFAAKKTLVVVNQTDFTDLSLADAVKSGWRISLYELCTHEKFQKVMTDTNYFFLLRVDGRFKAEREASIEYLTLVKGGESAKKGIEKMQEIVSMPLQPVGDESGKAFVFMPALINIMQEHIMNVSEDILKAYVGNSFYTNRVDKIGDKFLLFDKSDIGYEYSEEEMTELFGDKFSAGSFSDVSKAIIESSQNTVVSYKVSPANKKGKGFSYQLLIDTENHELVFYRRHKISSKLPSGFTQEDLKRISAPYRLK